MLLSNGLYRAGIAVLFVAAGSFIGGQVAAQDDAENKADDARAVRSVEERVKIQPYKGKPIYLPEPEQVAPPTIVTKTKQAEKYEDGKVRTERELAVYSDDHFEADGAYREYYRSGKPFVEGRYQRGRQHGEWTYWFENGTVNRKATYKNGQPDGTWEVRREDGTLAAKRSFVDGQRHGEWITFDKTGEQPVAEQHFDKGKPDGVWKLWYPNGKLRQQHAFKQGKREGVSTEWTEKGDKRAEVTYVDNQLEGPAAFWGPDGKKVAQQYKAGRLVSETKQ